MLIHSTQVHDAFNGGIDAVYALQAGFIGAWGEWHGSKHGLENNKTATQMVVASALFNLLPRNLKMTMRYGMQKAQKVLDVSAPAGHPLAFDVVTTATAQSGAAFARIGYDNDAIMTDNRWRTCSRSKLTVRHFHSLTHL